jgi:hypothetical protein
MVSGPLHFEAKESDMTWQPIETAPRTSERVLVRVEKKDGFMAIGAWRIGGEDTWLTDDRFGWCFPTHWQPLPSTEL